MPRYAKPPMPPEVEAIIDVIGNHVREAIVRHLALAGPSTAAEICEALGVATRGLIHQHLRALRDAGLVESDIPPEQRRGRRPLRWTINHRQLDQHLDRLRDYLHGR